VDKDTQTDEELTLQPQEEVLWESDGGPDRFDKIAWGFSLFWTFVFTVLTAILLSLLLEQLSNTGFSGFTVLILAGLLIAGTIVLTLARHMYNDYTRETEMNYAITNQRLIVANRSGANREIFTGRPFSSMQVERNGDEHDLTLCGNGEDKTEVVVQLLRVKNGAKAEKLILSEFLAET